jgi:hypothetical protein
MEALMRTIVVLLIAALVLTPTLAHAQASPAGGAGLAALVILPVLVILLLIDLEKKHPNWRDAKTPSPLPSPPSESQPSTAPGPAGGR